MRLEVIKYMHQGHPFKSNYPKFYHEFKFNVKTQMTKFWSIRLNFLISNEKIAEYSKEREKK